MIYGLVIKKKKEIKPSHEKLKQSLSRLAYVFLYDTTIRLCLGLLGNKTLSQILKSADIRRPRLKPAFAIVPASPPAKRIEVGEVETWQRCQL